MAVNEPMIRGLVVVVAGVVVVLATTRWAPIRRPGRVVGAVVVLVGLGLTGWGVALGAGVRSPRSIELGPGLRYERLALDEPRRQVFHLVTVDLDEPCVGLTTTVPAADGTVWA